MAESDYNPELGQLYEFNETYGTIDPADYDDVDVLVDQGIRTALQVEETIEPSTPLGRMEEWLAIYFTNVLGLNVQNANQLLLSAAAGQQLDAMAQWFQLRRKGAGYTTVQNVTVTGTAGVTLPAGLRARTENGDYFVSTSEVTLNNGVGQVAFRAVNPGVVPCDKGALKYIDTPVDGWASVSNDDSAGVIGQDIETDDSLRERIANDRTTAIGFLGAIKNALDEIEGVKSAIVTENNTGANLAVHGVNMQPHTIFACVDYDGSEDTENAIAQAIFTNKPCGTGYTDINNPGNSDTAHTKSVPVTDDFGNVYDVLFFLPQELPITVYIEISRRSYTGANLESDIKEAISDWFAVESPRVGEPIYATDILRHIEEKVAGVVVVACKVSDGGAQAGVSYIDVPAFKRGVFKSDGSIVVDVTR